jgi:hypothetical protein
LGLSLLFPVQGHCAKGELRLIATAGKVIQFAGGNNRVLAYLSMSMSLHNHFDLEHIEIDFTPEQTEVPVQAAAGRQGASGLEPLPIEAPIDPLPLTLHQAMWPEGAALWLPESEVTPLERESLSLPIQETIALESGAAPIPTSQEQSRKPLRTGGVGLLVRVLLYVGLVVGIVYVRQIGEEPIQVARKVDPNATGLGEARGATVPSDSEAMLIKNPFDRTEAFEFPPGTSKAEAREAVAKLLMERAHDRLPLLADASRRRGATAKHETRESSQLQDSQYRNSQAVPGRGPG